MTVGLILDTSALRAYVAGDLRALALAELMAIVEENGDTVGIPALCLLEACREAKSANRTTLLKFVTEDDHVPAVVLPVMAADVETVVTLQEQMTDAHGQVVAERAKHGAVLGTYEASIYADFVTEYDILNLGQS